MTNESSPARPPRRRARRVPAFYPVPLRGRRDGWTVQRQADFLGYLAETGSVMGACEAIGMSRNSAYRLRRRRDAESFAAAWDAALGKPHLPVDLSSAKSTGLAAAYRNRMGLLQVVMERGRYVGSHWKDDCNALLQHLGQVDRASARLPEFGGKPRDVQPPGASTPGVDFAAAEAYPR